VQNVPALLDVGLVVTANVLLLFVLHFEGFVKSRESSCTDVLQKWHQPSRKQRFESNEILFHCPVFGSKRKKTEAQNFDPHPLHLKKTDLFEFKDLLALLPKSSWFLHLLTQAPSSVVRDPSLPLTSRSVRSRIQHQV